LICLAVEVRRFPIGYLLVLDPAAPDPELVAPVVALLGVMVSNADIPFGPMVITTGLPSLVLARTTKASATTFTSEKPAFCKSCRSFWAVSIEP